MNNISKEKVTLFMKYSLTQERLFGDSENVPNGVQFRSKRRCLQTMFVVRDVVRSKVCSAAECRFDATTPLRNATPQRHSTSLRG